MEALGCILGFVIFLVLMLVIPVISLVVMPCWLIFRLILIVVAMIWPTKRIKRWEVLTKRPPLWFDLTDMESQISYIAARASGMNHKQALRQVVPERSWYKYQALKKLEPLKNAQGYELVYESRLQGWYDLSTSLGGSMPPPGRYVWRKMKSE